MNLHETHNKDDSLLFFVDKQNKGLLIACPKRFDIYCSGLGIYWQALRKLNDTRESDDRHNYVVDHAKPNFSKPQRDDSGCLS